MEYIWGDITHWSQSFTNVGLAKNKGDYSDVPFEVKKSLRAGDYNPNSSPIYK